MHTRRVAGLHQRHHQNSAPAGAALIKDPPVRHRTAPHRPRSLGLFGFGAFGKLVARELGAYFDITVCDPAYVGTVLDDGRAFAVRDLAETAACDIVVLAVPVARLEHLCQQIAPHLRQGALVVDVGSVKLAPMQAMASHLPDHVQILGTHPLFGPQSARDGIQNRDRALPAPWRHPPALRHGFSNVWASQ